MITAAQAAELLGMSARLTVSDPEPKESALVVYFRKSAEARKRATDKAKKVRLAAIAAKAKLEAADRKEKRRPLVAHHAGQRIDLAIAAHGRDDAGADQPAQGFAHSDGHVLPRDGRTNICQAVATNGLKARCRTAGEGGT